MGLHRVRHNWSDSTTSLYTSGNIGDGSRLRVLTLLTQWILCDIYSGFSDCMGRKAKSRTWLKQLSTHAQLGQIMDKIQKDRKNPTATSETWEQKLGVRRKSRVLHISPEHRTTRGAGKPPNTPFRPDPPLPSPRERNELAPHLREHARDLFSLLPAAAGAPVKPGRKWSVLINFYWQRKVKGPCWAQWGTTPRGTHKPRLETRH